MNDITIPEIINPELQVIFDRVPASHVHKINLLYDSILYNEHRIGEILKGSCIHAYEIGIELLEVKKIVGHNNLEKWQAKYFKGSERTAQVYRRIASFFGKNASVAVLKDYLEGKTINEVLKFITANQAKQLDFFEAEEAEVKRLLEGDKEEKEVSEYFAKFFSKYSVREAQKWSEATKEAFKYALTEQLKLAKTIGIF